MARTAKISVTDLDALENVVFAKRNIAPYVSPVLDSVTLGLVCKDLGIHGRAVPKMINGRQYIAFSGYPGLRKMFSGTVYSANNRRIVTMAIGALGIKNMVKKGGILTICITVPLTVLECYMKDRYSFSLLAGTLASDLMKIGVGSIMGAIFGLGVAGLKTFAIAPIATVIGVSIFSNIALEGIDRRYNLTEKLIDALEKMGEEINQMGNEAQTALFRGMSGFFRSQGLKIPNY